MTHLSAQVKDVILTANQVINRHFIADVAIVDAHLIGNWLDIELIAAIVGDHGVKDRYSRSQRDQFDRQIGANKAHAACDQHRLIFECFVIHIILIV